MEKALTERFKELIRVKSSSILDFSKRIDIAQTTLNSQLCSTRGISINVIMLTLNAFPDISAEWLLRGVGNMYKNAEASTDSEEEDSEEDKFYKDIIFTYQEMTKEYRKKIEYLEAELAKAAPFAGEEKKKQSKSA
jgi:hypothetical protein|uniref:Uncharacterized protein n=1 Tax=Siphoviridae sp. ctfbh2 TaxID=2827909 RepID=A0A8S5T4N8_9CAUD|nr:MAG TPA: hypothetical protein [Siphoviridae sp. ctfbh2]